MSITSVSRRRAAAWLGGMVAAAVGVVALPGIAQAHVSVQPGEVEGGGFSVVSFRVPNERDDASTTKVQVVLPEDQPLGSVRTTPIPGWTIKTTTRKLEEPIEMFGEELDTVVADVTWTATGDGIAPGQYLDFDLNLGQLPESGELVFRALQTYSNGEQVNWNEVSLDESVEAEHPAPILTITSAADTVTEPAAAGSDEGSTGEDVEGAVTETETVPAAATTSADADEASTVLPTTLSVAALLVALGALDLAWRRGRA